MSNKPQKHKYGHFGIMTEAYRGGRRKLRPEYVPEMAAWLLSMGQRQERIAQQLRGKLVQGSFPGLQASLRYCRQAIQTVEWLIHVLNEPFDAGDWDAACYTVADFFGIGQTADVIPLPNVTALTLNQHRETPNGDHES